MPVFDIDTAGKFYEEVVYPQWQDFVADNGSMRKAVMAVIAAYHMHDWVYGYKFVLKTSTLPANVQPLFETARVIANGSKHDLANTTFVQPGFSSDFSDDFARPLNANTSQGSMSLDNLLKGLMDFWEAEKTSGNF